ncbi:protein of unknown function [Paraburkholderia dioscoreae]|uniref:Uncharacterized protein n=1 Tax=Paraburkholderia dioscoreae TaxID=2604047 RepID=A0A5Q4Z2J1_9BURK|nr:protein of unknown function [Paraburkholderia dioscoreae]
MGTWLGVQEGMWSIAGVAWLRRGAIRNGDYLVLLGAVSFEAHYWADRGSANCPRQDIESPRPGLSA